MADEKITGLDSGTPKLTDLYIAVDTTDTTMALSGTDKSYLLEDVIEFTATTMFGDLAQNDVYVAGSDGTPISDGLFIYNPGTTVMTVPNILVKTGLRLEETGAGSDIITLQAPTSIAASWTMTFPVDNGSAGFALTTDGNGVTSWTDTASGSGDVDGPGSSTDNALVRWDGTSGDLIANSVAILSDAGALSALTELTVDNIDINGNTISSTNTNGNIELDPNGTGIVHAPALISSDVGLVLKQTSGGSNNSTIQSPSVLAGSLTWTLPAVYGTAGQALSTSGSGILTWTSSAAPVTGTFLLDFEGIWAAPQVVTMTYQVTGNIVTLYIPAFAAVATTPGFIQNSTTPLSVGLRPVLANQYVTVTIQDDGLICDGVLEIGTTGFLNIYPKATALNRLSSGTTNNFFGTSTSSATSGLLLSPVTYYLK